MSAGATGADRDGQDLTPPTRIGTLAHRLLAQALTELGGDASATPAPASPVAVAELTDRLLGRHRLENRAHRQTLRATVRAYFAHLLPPPGWEFTGSELPLPPGRIDLYWTAPDGRVLLDEVKTGMFGADLEATAAQCHRYLHDATAQFGEALIGIRVLSIRDPPRSWLLRPGQHTVPLYGSGYVHPAVPPAGVRPRPLPGRSGRPVR